MEMFKEQIQETCRKQSLGGCSIRVSKNQRVYTTGERGETIYLVESGQIKLLVPSPEGKECLLAIRTVGDIFGELCLCGQSARLETAIAMRDVTLKQVYHRRFLDHLKRESLLEGLVRYLALRIADQQELITTLATMNSEQRLARTLLHLGHIIGKSNPDGVAIDHRLSHKELAEMVGTTRTRIGMFLKRFQELGLIRLTSERRIVIEEEGLLEHIECDTSFHKTGTECRSDTDGPSANPPQHPAPA